MSKQLSQLDFWVIGAYFAAIFAIGIYLILKERKEKGLESQGYFLGGRNLGWFIVGSSLFASNIGSEHLVGLAGAGASGDFPAAQFEILAAFMLLLLGWLFVPFYIKSGVFTMPEFLEKRYDSWSRGYLSWVSIVSYVITKISITIAAGGIVFTALLGIDFWTGAFVIVVLTGLYTLFGGLKVVAYTDMIQLFVLLGGSIALTVYGLEAVGGWDQVVAKTDDSYLSLWRSLEDPDFPWTGVLLGAPILGVWYWCTDQFIVQRVLAAKDIPTARKGTMFAGFLKLLPLFLFVIPGVIAYALSVGENPQLVFPTENGKTVYDSALPVMTMQILPTGLRGLVVAGLLAALMSSLSSVFNSCSTLFTFDVYKKYKPQASEKELVKTGQLATGVLVVLGLLWVPCLSFIEGGLFQKLQSIQAYISPPIAAVFLLGITYKKLNAKGAKWSLLTGAFLGALRLVLEMVDPRLSPAFAWFVDMNFLHFALLLFVLCSGVLIGVSTLGTAPSAEALEKTTLDSWSSLRGTKTNRVLTILLLVLIMIIWYEFS
ncbi:MAG: sodium:solute symporter [Schleiferiaceae bacterium]